MARGQPLGKKFRLHKKLKKKIPNNLRKCRKSPKNSKKISKNSTKIRHKFQKIP